MREKEVTQTSVGSNNWGYCFDDLKSEKKHSEAKSENRAIGKGGGGDLPFQSLHSDLATGFGFEVVGKGADIRKEFADKSYRNPYIDSDEWI